MTLHKKKVLFLSETEEGWEGETEDGYKIVLLKREGVLMVGLGKSYYRAFKSLTECEAGTNWNLEQIFQAFELEWVK